MVRVICGQGGRLSRTIWQSFKYTTGKNGRGNSDPDQTSSDQISAKLSHSRGIRASVLSRCSAQWRRSQCPWLKKLTLARINVRRKETVRKIWLGLVTLADQPCDSTCRLAPHKTQSAGRQGSRRQNRRTRLGHVLAHEGW